MRRKVFMGLGLLLTSVMVTLAWAESKESSTEESAAKSVAGEPARPATAATDKSDKTDKVPKRLPGFTEEREAAALTFVRANHTELVPLLEQLKQSNPQQYQRAIRELFKSSEHLAQTQEKNPRRYEIELAQWKVGSRIQLLVARLTMGSDPATEEELRQALLEQMSLRKQQISQERERIEARLAELKQELDEVQADQAKQVDKRMAKLIEEARKSRVAIRGSNKKPKTKDGGAATEPAKTDPAQTEPANKD